MIFLPVKTGRSNPGSGPGEGGPVPKRTVGKALQ
jgi:hypothetical protein